MYDYGFNDKKQKSTKTISLTEIDNHNYEPPAQSNSFSNYFDEHTIDWTNLIGYQSNEVAPVQAKQSGSGIDISRLSLLESPEMQLTGMLNPYSGRELNLPESLAESIQGGFGIDMSKLSLLESPEVAQMGAKATAQGNVIRFAPGEYKPDTTEGLKILGHELNHIREQAQGKVQANIEGTNIHFDQVHEASCDRAGEAFACGTLNDATSVSIGCSNSGGEVVQNLLDEELNPTLLSQSMSVPRHTFSYQTEEDTYEAGTNTLRPPGYHLWNAIRDPATYIPNFSGISDITGSFIDYFDGMEDVIRPPGNQPFDAEAIGRNRRRSGNADLIGSAGNALHIADYARNIFNAFTRDSFDENNEPVAPSARDGIMEIGDSIGNFAGMNIFGRIGRTGGKAIGAAVGGLKGGKPGAVVGGAVGGGVGEYTLSSIGAAAGGERGRELAGFAYDNSEIVRNIGGSMYTGLNSIEPTINEAADRFRDFSADTVRWGGDMIGSIPEGISNMIAGIPEGIGDIGGNINETIGGIARLAGDVMNNITEPSNQSFSNAVMRGIATSHGVPMHSTNNALNDAIMHRLICFNTIGNNIGDNFDARGAALREGSNQIGDNIRGIGDSMGEHVREAADTRAANIEETLGTDFVFDTIGTITNAMSPIRSLNPMRRLLPF